MPEIVVAVSVADKRLAAVAAARLVAAEVMAAEAVDSRHRPPPSKLSLPVQVPAGAEEVTNPRVVTID